MRPTQVTLSDMPGGKAYMGWWGEMGSPKQKGIITYTQSPFRQAVARGLFTKWLFNGYSRIAGHLPYVVPPIAIGYAIYAYAKRTDAYQSSKAGHIEAMQKEGHHH